MGAGDAEAEESLHTHNLFPRFRKSSSENVLNFVFPSSLPRVPGQKKGAALGPLMSYYKNDDRMS